MTNRDPSMPPPPPPPGLRAFGPPPAGRGGGGLPPPPLSMRGPPPGQQSFPLPIRQPVSSTRYVDLTPRVPLDEDACRKRLTTYEAFSIRKVLPPGQKKDKDKKVKSKKDTKDTSTWAKSEQTRESWTHEEMAKQIKKLNETHSVTEKKQKLRNFQQSQVNQVLDGLKSAEHDNNFEWSLAQIDQKFQPVGKKKETTVITVYAKRAPRTDVNAVELYRLIERSKAEKMAMANRPPQPLPAEPITVSAANAKPPRQQGSKRYHDGSSSYSRSTSDSESDSDYSSSENTSISTRSGRHSKRYSQKGRRGRSRSHSRRREHRRIPYIVDAAPARPYVPEVPRAVPTVDEINAAYQAGKAAERLSAIDRYPSPRSRAIVYNGYHGPRYPVEPRYVDDIYGDDLRRRDEEQLRREDWVKSREAENYIERRVRDNARVLRNPFSPNQYPSSVDSGW